MTRCRFRPDCDDAAGEKKAWHGGLSAAVSGFGMALLYPNLSAAVADISHLDWRGSAIGIYRFWRDLGYGIGALGPGVAAHFSGSVEAAFWFVAISTFLSGSILRLFGEETHPRLNPVSSWTLNRPRGDVRLNQ
jgi:predicted MFS family arabinose efflux permease